MKRQNLLFLSFEKTYFSKKGISQPMIAIVLGLVFIILVLVVFGAPLKNYVDSLWKEGLFSAGKQETSFIAGTDQKRNIFTETPLEFSGTKEEIAVDIAKEAKSCWDRRSQMNANNNWACGSILITKIENGESRTDINKQIILQKLENLDKTAAARLQATSEDSDFGYTWENLQINIPYKLCSDTDTIGQDDLMISIATCTKID